MSPIRAEDRDRYPDDWPEVSARIRRAPSRTAPAGPLARLQRLAAGWDVWAAEAGTLAGLIEGGTPEGAWYPL